MLPPRPLPASNKGRGLLLGDGAAAKAENMLPQMAQAPPEKDQGLRARNRDSPLAMDTSRGNPHAVKERQAALARETHPDYKFGLPFPYLPFEEQIARRKKSAAAQS
jgi:hypothetical protein